MPSSNRARESNPLSCRGGNRFRVSAGQARAETEGLRQMTRRPAGEPSAGCDRRERPGFLAGGMGYQAFQGLVTLRLAWEYDGGYIDTAFVLLRADNQPSGTNSSQCRLTRK